MKARPILFSSPMVRALLDGRKSQTRRVVKGAALDWLDVAGFDPAFVADPENDVCPYGKPGDLLWVRETFARNGLKDGEKVFYRADGDSQFMGEMRESNGNITRYYTDHWERNGEKRTGADWKPSIHMPRWASRLTLEITGVRVERLQDISEADALAEGVARDGDYPTEDRRTCSKCLGNGVHPALGTNLGVTEVDCSSCDTAAKRYRHLWESINGPGSWAENPWVWCLSFNVHRCNVDELLKVISHD